MKRDKEETIFQKIVVISVEVFIIAILIVGSVLMDFYGGLFICLPFAAAVVKEFFSEDGDSRLFGSGDNSPTQGELVSYREYPEVRKESSQRTVSSGKMDDLFTPEDVSRKS